MDTFTLIFSIVVGLIVVVAIAWTAWLFSRQKKLKEWDESLQKSIKASRFNIARSIVMQHSDPHWREEWLQKIAQKEREL